MATFYVDFEGGNDANDGLSFANRKKSLTSVSTAAGGDSIRVMASRAPTTLGSATWNNLSKTVTIPANLTANIDRGETAWTPTANVTATTSATRKEGATSSSLAIAAAFTTGQVALKAFAATDFSAFNQVSFFIRTNATVAANTLELRLCSDAAGTVTVNTIPIPALTSANVFQAITFDNGAALGASIQSVVLQALLDPGTVTVLLDNILACKNPASADAITLSTIISKDVGEETWYAIQSINGTAVLLDVGPNSLATTTQGYYGATETVTTYIRRPDLLDITTSALLTIVNSGTNGAPIVYSGGWNRTDMSTQTDETWVSGRNGATSALVMATKSFITISKINCIKFNDAASLTGTNSNIIISDCAFNNLTGSFMMAATTYNCTFTNIVSNNCANLGTLEGSNHLITNYTSNNSSFAGPTLGLDSSLIVGFNSHNNAARGAFASLTANTVIRDASFSDNTGVGILNRGNNLTLINALITDATEVDSDQLYADYRIMSHKHDQTTNNHQVFTDGGLISSETGADRHTASGIAWKMFPTATTRSATYPLSMPAAKIACTSGTLVTVSVWVKRSNAGITAQLFMRGGQIAGSSSDLTTSALGTAGTYEQISLSFTPAESGVIDIDFRVYGGTTFNATFDDMTIVQL